MKLEWKEVETFDNFLKYGEGKFGKTIKVWEVQTMGYMKGSVLEPGLVSRGNGFTDAPDAEFISEGNHTKKPGQVALGRHGNWFHWGYAGGPKHMTEQGKLVFLNAIHYIAKFKGQKPLSPKIAGVMWQKEWVDGIENKDYVKEWKEYAALYTGKRAKNAPTLEELMARRENQLYPKFGLDFPKYKAFYIENLPYMRADRKKPRNFIVDEEAKKLGKSFYDEDFLPYCLNELKNGNETALVLLKRYTQESFSTYKEWKKWYKKNKKRLFFTVHGGCKYYINIYK